MDEQGARDVWACTHGRGGFEGTTPQARGCHLLPQGKKSGGEASSGVPRGGNGPAMPRRGSQDGWGWGGHLSGQEVPDIGSPISAVLFPPGEMLGKA